MRESKTQVSSIHFRRFRAAGKNLFVVGLPDTMAFRRSVASAHRPYSGCRSASAETCASCEVDKGAAQMGPAVGHAPVVAQLG